jgi:hypothetical protein
MDEIPFLSSWHADHVTAFVITERTLLTDMQPLCAPCNLKKGAKRMADVSFFTFLPEGSRIPVRLAIHTIVERILAGEKTTAIVVPPRVGKSSIARQSAIECQERGLVGPVMILSPWVILRDQINNPKLVADMCAYHKTNMALRPPTAVQGRVLSTNKIDPRFYDNTDPRPYWWSMTMAMACSTSVRAILVDAAAQCDVDRRPMLVFIDESNMTSSGPDGWGGLANELTEAGALLVLMTGTPERADNLAPYGYRMVRGDTKEARYVTHEQVDDDHRKSTYYVGTRVKYQLEADYTYTFAEAWADELITKIDCRWFTFQSDGEIVADLSEADGLRALAKAVRDPLVIQEGVRLMLDELKLRRYTDNQAGKADPTTAAIVYVGSDREDDPTADWHAREVRRIILGEWPKFFPGLPNIVTATEGIDKKDSGEQKAADRIREFAQGAGDILIVKMMGGVGLDSPRLKVGADFSTVRTWSAFCQRVSRVLTLLKGVNHATIILPDDPCTRRLYGEIVLNQGGGFSRIEDAAITSEVIEKIDETEPPEVIPPVISNAARAGSTDISLRHVATDLDVQIDLVLAKNPVLAVRLTRREVADMIENGLVIPPTDDVVNLSEPPPTPVYDLDAEIDKRRRIINKMCDALTNRVITYTPGPDNPWAKARRLHMSKTKNFAGIRGELGACDEISKLDKAVAYLEKELKSQVEKP